MGTLCRHCNPALAALLAVTLYFPLQASASNTATVRGLHAMSDTDLAAVSARGLSDGLLGLAPDSENPGSKMIGKLTSSLDKGLHFLAVETALTDVMYDPARARTFANADGSITQILPASIGEVSFDNIRVKGDVPGASFGSISVKAIDLHGTSITLSPRR